jgi:hypothetical protein
VDQSNKVIGWQHMLPLHTMRIKTMMLMTTYQSMASLAGTTKHYLKELMGAIG